MLNIIKKTIQIASDIHLECYNNGNYIFTDIIKPRGTYLALLGDIGYPTSSTYKKFIGECSMNFEKVFLISGNHEYYVSSHNKNMNDIDDLITTIASAYNNVIYLNNDTYELDDDYVILGSTLWSNIPVGHSYIMRESINDYHKIYKDGRKIMPSETSHIHDKNIEWLVAKLDEYKHKKIIMLSHHLPSFKCVVDKYKGSDINYAFASNLDHIIENNSNIKYWFYGHTHFTTQLTINNTICASNPCGYKYNSGIENKYYNSELIFDL
jgi:predicted phosphohydrolase